MCRQSYVDQWLIEFMTRLFMCTMDPIFQPLASDLVRKGSLRQIPGNQESKNNMTNLGVEIRSVHISQAASGAAMPPTDPGYKPNVFRAVQGANGYVLNLCTNEPL